MKKIEIGLANSWAEEEYILEMGGCNEKEFFNVVYPVHSYTGWVQ